MDEERRVESDPEDTAPTLKTFLRERNLVTEVLHQR